MVSTEILKKLPVFKAYEIINRLPLFAELSPDEKQLIANNQNIFFLISKGSTFISEGELENCFYLILNGSAKVKQSRVECDELHVGDVVGVSGFLRDITRTCSVYALEDVLALKFSRFQFKKLPIKIRELIKDRMLDELSKRIDRLNTAAYFTKST